MELGGVYSPGATARMDPYPDQLYFAGVFFSADPDRVEELLDAAYTVIAELQSEGITPENLGKARETLLRSHEQSLEDNSFWLGTLRAYAVDQSVDPLDVLTYPARVAAVTAEEIQALAQQILVPKSSIQLILYPEGFEGRE